MPKLASQGVRERARDHYWAYPHSIGIDTEQVESVLVWVAAFAQSERIRQAREILADCEEVCAIYKSAGEPVTAAGAGHCAVRIRELLKEMEAENG